MVGTFLAFKQVVKSVAIVVGEGIVVQKQRKLNVLDNWLIRTADGNGIGDVVTAYIFGNFNGKREF